MRRFLEEKLEAVRKVSDLEVCRQIVPSVSHNVHVDIRCRICATRVCFKDAEC